MLERGGAHVPFGYTRERRERTWAQPIREREIGDVELHFEKERASLLTQMGPMALASMHSMLVFSMIAFLTSSCGP